jgi:hypothetical protein
MPAFGKLRQQDFELKASLGCIVRAFKKKKKEEEKKEEGGREEQGEEG